MKTRIDTHVKTHIVYTCTYKEIHIVDWKKFTNENLKVHSCMPLHPETGEVVRSVCLENENEVEILVDAFGENALEYSKKRRSKQCECVIYPSICENTNWVLFVEMKYAEDEVAAFREDNNYPEKMIEQIKQTVHFFRDKQIISLEKEVYAIVSFPNLISAFNSFLFNHEDIENLYLDEGIIIRGTNRASIVDSDELTLLG